MNRRTRARCVSAAGFTLIEIMVVVMILGLLATMVVTNVAHSAEIARRRKAESDLASIFEAARMFQLDRGRVPTPDQLLERDQHGGSYLETIPLDPWDHAYEVRAVADRRCEVRSCGPDGVGDTDDDLVAPPR